MNSTTNSETGIFRDYWHEVRTQFGLGSEIENLRCITKTDALSILRNIKDVNIEALFNALM